MFKIEIDTIDTSIIIQTGAISCLLHALHIYIARSLKIENNVIGSSRPCYIIAEIGVNHNGKLSIAKKLIDAAVECGVNAVKFQKRNLESLYRKEALENPNSESQGFEILLAELKEVELSNKKSKKIII